MQASLITQIRNRLAPEVAALGAVLLDVVMVHEHGRSVVRLIIDRRGGVDIDLCVAVSERCDPIVTNELNITSHDVFEVQSAGLDYNLKTTDDLNRHVGEVVDVKRYQAIDGEKTSQGELLAVDDETLSVRLDTGDVRTIARRDIASVKRSVTL